MPEPRDQPECLNRRYKAVDQLINELDTMIANRNSATNRPDKPGGTSKDPGVKLMCDFWNILKQEPGIDLPDMVHHKMCMKVSSSTVASECTRPRSYSCYMAKEDKKPLVCCSEESQDVNICCAAMNASKQSDDPNSTPLSKVLTNLKEAASYDKRCTVRVNELMKTQKDLQSQIQALENRETTGVKMLKQADCMWSCMEDAYKVKIAESQERQKEFSKQLKEVEKSDSKWRKNKKDLESQINTINRCHLEISDKINQKTSDIKCMDMEIEGFKKQIDANKKTAEGIKDSLAEKKKASDGRMAIIAKNAAAVEKAIAEQKDIKQSKEDESNIGVREAREELQKLCKLLLQRKLENEDLIAEKTAIINEIQMLEATLAGCKDRCKKKEENLYDNLKKVETEIVNFKLRCARCHQCTDSNDVRRFCTDCPLCLAERECLYEDGHCDPDHSLDCVCQSVKQKFLDNVFENMYIVLAKQAESKTGKSVAQRVLDCLQTTKNGKLSEETKHILHDFVLTTIKRNLNLTIVGGAVKTRCEMDPETYTQLMVCLKKVKADKLTKNDKGTDPKKKPCTRWGGATECNCPKGPKACVCTNKAPPAPSDPSPCPTDKEDEATMEACPFHKDDKDGKKCGADCGMRVSPGSNLGQWQQDPCAGPSCTFKSDMKAALCAIEPDSHASLTKQSYKTPVPYIPSLSVLGDQIPCKCGKPNEKPCSCHKGKNRGSSQDCYKDPCHESFINFESENIERRSKRLSGEIKLENIEGNTKLGKTITDEIDMKIPSVQKDVFNKSLKYMGRDSYAKGYHFEDSKRFDQSGSNENIAELKANESGMLIIDLNDNVIDNILTKKKDKLNNVTASLIETDSGRILVNFDASPNDIPIINMNVNRSESGRITLVIDKNIDKLLCRSVAKDVDLESTLSIEVKKMKKIENDTTLNSQDHLKMAHTLSEQNRCIKSILEDIIYLDDKKNKKEPGVSTIATHILTSLSENNMRPLANTEKLYTSRSIDNYKNELLKKYECEDGNLNIRVMCENHVAGNANAQITITRSGNVALEVRDLTKFEEISNQYNEYPVLLKRSPSGIYMLFIGKISNAPNTVLRRTSSGGFLVVITETIPLKSMEMTKTGLKDLRSVSANQAFKIILKGISDKGEVKEPPAILKSTVSGNYILVPDKEFEKQYSYIMNNPVFIDNDCFVELQRTSSSTLLINFEDDSKSLHSKRHALLTKSPSDNIKVLVDGPMSDNANSHSIESGSRKAFVELLSNLPNYKIKDRSGKSTIDKKTVNDIDKDPASIRVLKIKSSSDSRLYQDVRIKLQQREELWSAPSTLKKTSSGQLAVVLDKDSKKTFINDIHNYLANSSQTTIPVTRTDSGEITIDLTSEPKGQRPCAYERLKISASGSIYIVLDEKTYNKCSKLKSAGSVSLKKGLNKRDVDDETAGTSSNAKPAAATNAKPDECSCEPNKCMCHELLKQWDQDILIETKNKFQVKPKQCNTITLSGEMCNGKSCDSDIVPKDGCSQSTVKSQLCVPNTTPVDSETRSRENRSREPSLSTGGHPDCNTSKNSTNAECYYSLNINPFVNITKHNKNNASKSLKSSLSGLTWSTFDNTYDDYTSKQTSFQHTDDDEKNLNTENNEKPRCSRFGSTLDWDSTAYLEHQLPYFLKHFSLG